MRLVARDQRKGMSADKHIAAALGQTKPGDFSAVVDVERLTQLLEPQGRMRLSGNMA
jgi:hypothetical protein